MFKVLLNSEGVNCLEVYSNLKFFFEFTYLSKLEEEHVRKGSQIAIAALFTNASNGPNDSTMARVFSQSAISTSAMSIEGYSLCKASRCDLVFDNATIFAPALHSSTAIPLPMPESDKPKER